MPNRILDLYHRHAAAWARQRGRGLIERAWLDRFCADLPGSGRAVLDLGCGSGRPIAAALIEAGCRVTGADGAAAMIALARADFPAQTWIVADMRALPPLAPFDGVIAWHSLFHLRPEDQRPLFAAFRRLCRPGGALMFTSGTAHGEAIGQFEGEALYHASLDPAEYRGLLQANGFALIRHVERDPACGGATIWLARRIARDLQGGPDDLLGDGTASPA